MYSYAVQFLNSLFQMGVTVIMGLAEHIGLKMTISKNLTLCSKSAAWHSTQTLVFIAHTQPLIFDTFFLVDPKTNVLW